MTLKRISDVDSPEIGRFYLVPTVHARYFLRTGFWPVIGPWHDDAKLINFPCSHYHVDIRFLSASQMGIDRAGRMIIGAPICKHPRQEIPIGPVIYRRRKYKRHFPRYPAAQAWWMPDLEKAYADKKVKPGLVCPHRGAPLRGLIPDEDGCVTCPLHGLRWNLETGELMPRYPTPCN